MMTDLFKEVQEEYRQEQIIRFWNQNAPKIIAILIIALVCAGGASYWQTKKIEKKQEETYAFAQAALASSEKGPAEAAAAFKKALSQLSGGRLIAANLAHAEATDQAGDKAAAIREFDDIVANKEATSSEHDLAEISSIGLQLDTADPTALSTRLEPLADEKSAWRYTAREFQALVALRQGDKQKAFDIAGPLAKDKDAPDGVHTAAAQIAAISLEGLPAPAAALNPISTLAPVDASDNSADAQK